MKKLSNVFNKNSVSKNLRAAGASIVTALAALISLVLILRPVILLNELINEFTLQVFVAFLVHLAVLSVLFFLVMRDIEKDEESTN